MELTAEYRAMPGAKLLQEAVTANPQVINSKLAEAGFGDISRDQLLLLGSIAVTGRPASDQAQALGISGQAASQMAAELTERGYLSDGDEQDRPGPPFTLRARALMNAARGVVWAARWADFEFRPGDIVISTLPKSGTTWVQMICALLIFRHRHSRPRSHNSRRGWIT